MNGSAFLIFIVGFLIGMAFLRWISNNKNTSQNQKNERVHFEDQEFAQNQDSDSSVNRNKTSS